MPDSPFCVQHAQHEQLVVATGIASGQSTCGTHGESAVEPVDGYDAASCLDCLGTRHRAYFVVEDQPLCIRHAADAVFPFDDMGAHDMAHAAYIRLHQIGVPDAY